MAAIDTYDAVVLGSGEAGKSIAWHLGSSGPTRRRRRAALCGRFLPQYRLPAEQELRPRCEHRSYCRRERVARKPCRRQGVDAAGPGAQTDDGRRPGPKRI